jgi:predicted TIM-barrel fold metal-dependent hydrolase
MATAQNFQRMISADSHVMEPLDLWWNALGGKLGDRTPRVLNEYQGHKGDYFYTGYQGAPVSTLRDDDPETDAAIVEASERGLKACGYDPGIRVRFQEEAGIEAEVLNPTRLLGIMRNPDAEVVQACSEVYNDWLAEFVSHQTRRLIGISTIQMNDVDWAVNELERTAKKGLVGTMINCQAPEGCPPYRDPIYDRFWAAASDAEVAITLHILTGRTLDPLILAPNQKPEEHGENPGMWVEMMNEIQPVLANDFIFGGILERFPKLKVICSEFEMSWIPGFLARLDQIEDVGPQMFTPRLRMRAREYMTTRIWHGFIDDTAAGFAIPYVGADRVLWGSDFPHIRSIGLDADSAVFRLIDGLSREDQEKVVGANAATVFNLN